MRYATVFELMKNLRQSVYAKAMVERLKGEVEIDEVYIKAGLKGKKKMRRCGRKRGLKARGGGTYDLDKVPVVAVVERRGKIRIRPHRNLKTKEIIDRYLSDVDPGAIVYTDDFSSYNASPAIGTAASTTARASIAKAMVCISIPLKQSIDDAIMPVGYSGLKTGRRR